MQITTPMKAIRGKCLDCSGDSSNEVKLCEITECTLHAYRLGKNPNIKPRPMTEEQKERARARLEKMRLAKKSKSS